MRRPTRNARSGASSSQQPPSAAQHAPLPARPRPRRLPVPLLLLLGALLLPAPACRPQGAGASAVATAASTSVAPTTFAPAATAPLGAAASSDAAFQPLWGCEARALPRGGGMHLVVSTLDADPEQLLPWLWHLGLTNAHVFVYHRLEGDAAAAAVRALYDGVALPCGMELTVLPLLPNKGREAAVFLHHLIAHFEVLPMALVLVHDHGPASRHSLCGPFYRRLRAYYRGLRERRAHAAAAARGVARKRTLFGRFAGMVVTLSSGCAETWSRGCCAALICSSSRPACPFEHQNCTHAEPDPQVVSGPTPGVRQYYLHAGGLYDPRYENQAVGPGGALFPHALVRYVGGAHRSSDMWNISHEYPPNLARRSKEETMQLLNGLLERHNFTSRRRTLFKSCCASLVVRREHVRRWDLELYRELLSYSMDPTLDYEATKAVSGPGWALWADRDYNQRDVLDYMRVDVRLRSIQGCPAQRSAPLQQLVAQMRARAGGAAGATRAG